MRHAAARMFLRQKRTYPARLIADRIFVKVR
jgi:hypothetical protein